MKILEVYIQHFGTLHDRRFTFDDGLNVLREDNGFGKSTLLGFIKAMFYGFFDTTARNLEANDRKRYLPWDGGTCGGSLTFEYDGATYRIERTFGAKAAADTLLVFDETLGKRTDKLGDTPGEVLFGIDSEGFLRTLALSERVFEEKENESITDRLSSLVGTGGGMEGLEDGQAFIKKQISELKKTGKRGEIDLTQREICELEDQIRTLNMRMERIPALRAELGDKSREQQLLTEEKAKLTKELRDDPTLGVETVKREELEKKSGELAVLRERFSAGTPTEEEIARVQQLDGRYNASQLDEYRELREVFGTTFSESTLNVQRATYNRALVLDTTPRVRDFYEDYPYMRGAEDISEEEIKQYPQYKKRKLCRISALSLTVLGALLLLGGIFITALLFVGIACIVGAAIAFLIAPKTVLDGEKAKRIAKIEAEAKPYGEALLALWVKRERAGEDRKREDAQRAERDSLLAFLRGYGYHGEDVREGFPYVENRWKRYRELCDSGLGDAEAQMREVMRFREKYKSFGEPLYESLRRELYRMSTLKVECEALSRVLSSPTLSQRDSKQSRLGEIEERLELLRRDTIRLQRELDELEVLDDKIEEKNAEREELVLKKEHSEYRLHILEATARMLETAKESMQSSYLIPMRKSFDALLTELGEKEAGEVTLDASFKLSCKHRGVSHTVDAMSRGERDLYLLISRLAIVDTLYPEGMLPPIFLDDPFVAFDDARVDKALTYLNAIAKKRQIIYLTCSSARAR